MAFDMDGVLADMESALTRHAEALFGEAVAEEVQTIEAGIPDRGDAAPPGSDDVATLPVRRMTARRQRQLWRHVQSIENFWETLDEIQPGVIQRLGAMAADRRWEIIFLTRRPETSGRTAQVQSQRWLEARGFPLPSVYVVQGSRGRIASALDLDFVVDDRPENCLDVVMDSCARAILVWRDDETKLPEAARRIGIVVVKTAGECLDILIEAARPDPEPPHLVSRVMRALGLGESDDQA